MRQKRKFFIGAILALVCFLVALRMALPTIVQRFVNNKLDELPEYDGSVGDVDIHLWRGAYSIEEVDIVKTTGEVEVPFFESRLVEFSVEWRELLHGAVVGEVLVHRGKLNFVKGESKADSQTSIDGSWLEIVQELFPFRINRFEITDGEVWFRDVKSDPKVDLYLTNLVALCTNLYNTRELKTDLPADLRAKGMTLGGGEVEAQLKLDPLADEPRFDMELALRRMDLTALNELLEAYGKFNVKRGTFECFVEVAGQDGRFDGYVKPFFQDLDVLEIDQDAKNPIKLAWQALVAGAMKLFKNHPKDQVATKIPIEGTFEKTDVNVGVTVLNVLKNAFSEGFSRKLDNSIDLFKRDDEGKEKADTPKKDG